MSDLPWIDDKGTQVFVLLPLAAAGDQATRTEHALSVFAALAPVVRPLAIEVGYGYRDEAFLDVVRIKPKPRYCLLVEERALNRVAIRGRARPTIVPELSLDTLRGYLVPPADQPVPPGLTWDWYFLRTRAVAVRALSGQRELRFANLEQPVLPFEDDWFAGPLGESGWEATAPIDIELMSSFLGLGLTTDTHWPPWFDRDSPEGKLRLQTLETLVARGWQRDPGY